MSETNCMRYSKKDDLEYILAGHAIFTVKSDKLLKRYTYKVIKNKYNHNKYNCYVLFGTDNKENYRFIGLLDKKDFTFKKVESALLDRTRVLLAYISLLLKDDEPLPKTCHMYRSDRCALCGKLLTTPESLLSGYGPNCRKYVKGGD